MTEKEEEEEELNNCLVVANTHLLFNPKRGDIKMAQLRILLAELYRVSTYSAPASSYRVFSSNTRSKPKFYPTILCGDFNLTPASPLYKFIKLGRLDVRGMQNAQLSGQSGKRGKSSDIEPGQVHLEGIDSCGRFEHQEDDEREDQVSNEFNPVATAAGNLKMKKKQTSHSNQSSQAVPVTIRHPFNFSSVYDARNRKGAEFISTIVSERPGIVDFIFFTDQSDLRLIGLRKMLTVPQFKRTVRAIPNQHFGSDHFNLVARFSLSDQK